jgi:hypothetical protein
MNKKDDGFAFLGVLLLVFFITGAGGTVSDSSDSSTSTCTDGIDNDGDGFIDFNSTDSNADLDCDPQNPNYTGQEDGNANSFQSGNSSKGA